MGVEIDGSTANVVQDNLVGGTTAAARNIISGNTAQGVLITGANAVNNTVAGNYVGTNSAGSTAIQNGGGGVYLISAGSNTIGGTVAGDGNVISGNNGDGVNIDSKTTGTIIEGNYIGTNAAGTTALANDGTGVNVLGMSNTIGGSVAGAGNVVSGNSAAGISLDGTYLTGSNNNIVEGNYVGTDYTGANAVSNGNDGIYVDNATTDTIGGTTTADRNVISGNSQSSSYGINLKNSSSITVQGDYIGLSAAGTAAVGNANGISINGSNDDVIGGAAAGDGNVISGNSGDGIYITGRQPPETWLQEITSAPTPPAPRRWGFRRRSGN